MEVIPYSVEWKEQWDSFVQSSNNGTMFHEQKFFDYHAPNKFNFNHLMIVDNGCLLAVLPGAVNSDNIFESPIGASYGSIITKDVKFKMAMEIVEAFIIYGKKNGYSGFELTAPPMVYEKHPNQNLDFAMLWQGFSYSLHYISSAIKLNDDRDILSRFSRTAKLNVKKTSNNDDIRVELNERYDQFYPILLKNKAKHDAKPTHSLEDLIKLNQLMPGRLKLFMLYYKDIPIGGTNMFFVNDTCALCFYNMIDYDYDYLKPAHRLIYESMKYCKAEGYTYYDIGVSQDTKAANPMTPSMSLIDFKEQFDAKTIMRNTLSIRF